tara:strand:- start:399 stop:581 length:183 start_codon:yes stop_codon:yes gene_type:complete
MILAEMPELLYEQLKHTVILTQYKKWQDQQHYIWVVVVDTEQVLGPLTIQDLVEVFYQDV